MTFKEAETFLERFINYERGFKKYRAQNYNPSRVAWLLDKAGIDDSSLSYIHIAGTKGKGSCAHYCSVLLEESGHKVGKYTSPHLFSFTERIQINSRNIEPDEFASLVDRYGELLLKEESTYFEALTFFAVVHFVETGCEYAVLETGMGGRLDSTNFCDPTVSIITPISYDHTQFLGDTLEKIANEKAGIIKPLRTVVAGMQQDEAMSVLKARAMEMDSPLYALSDIAKYEIVERGREGSVINAVISIDKRRVELAGLNVRAMGDVAVENFLTCIAALMSVGIIPATQAIERAGGRALAMRMEVRGHTLFDVSHNGASLEALFKTVRDYIQADNVHLYIGVLEGKENERMAEVIRRNAGDFTLITCFDFSTPEGGRKSNSLDLYERLKDLKKVEYKDSVSKLSAHKDEFNICTGSFYSIESLHEKF